MTDFGPATMISWPCHCGCGTVFRAYVRDMDDPDHLEHIAIKAKKRGGFRPDVIVEVDRERVLPSERRKT